MKENQINIRTFLERFDRGDFNNPDVGVQCAAGWYDWWCRDKSLCNKTKKLGNLLKQLCKPSKRPPIEQLFIPKINIDTMYVFFKNNCPGIGTLYDDFRVCDMITGDVIFTIVPQSGHKSCKGQAEIWGRSNNFKGPLVVGKWQDVKQYFSN